MKVTTEDFLVRMVAGDAEVFASQGRSFVVRQYNSDGSRSSVRGYFETQAKALAFRNKSIGAINRKIAE